MIRTIILILISFYFICNAQSSSSQPIAFVGVDVLTMDKRGMLSDQTVVVNEGIIQSIGKRTKVKIPSNARVIESQNNVLMPGLIDAHIHLRKADQTALISYLEAGITTARDMNGRPKLLEWKERIISGDLIGPTLQVASPTIANWSSPKEGYPTPETEREGRELVRRFYNEGYDLIKIYTFLGDEAYRGIIDESKKIGIPVSGHVPVKVGLVETISSGIHSIEHLTEYVGTSLTGEAKDLDEKDFRSLFGAGEINWAKLDSLISLTKSANVWNVPTLVWFDRNLPAPVAKDSWSNDSLRIEGSRNRREIVRRMHAAGCLLGVGTDSDDGGHLKASAIHDELMAMSEAGLSPYEVIHAATIGNATMMNISMETGTIAVGKRADLLLLPCDPTKNLDCLKRLNMVLARGRIVYEK